MLDGYVAPGRFLYGDGVAWRGGVRTGPATERPFVFQQVVEKSQFHFQVLQVHQLISEQSREAHQITGTQA
jgi:hypothetical protein